MADMRHLLNPRSVAVVGVSARAEALGNRVLRNLTRAGYAGIVYGVNPREKRAEGFDCFPSVQALPQVPECVAIAVSAEKVLPALEEAAARGSKAAVIFASGFSEVGGRGRELKLSLESFCRASGTHRVRAQRARGAQPAFPVRPLTARRCPRSRSRAASPSRRIPAPPAWP